jgi:PHD/YefM family antitoxin component YafN of YafNO toxin-antitoxin module
MHPQYITDATGKRVSIVLPLSEYEALMEDLEDLAAIADRRDEPSLPHDELLAGLKRDGVL